MSLSFSRATKLNIFAWKLSLGVTIVAFVAWWQAYGSRIHHLSTYQLFPLFGLIAFSLMWSHYIVSAVRQWLNIDKQATKAYFELTSLAVLLAILLHPSLLAWQLWRDGFGLPPGSELRYVDGLWFFVLMGMTSWLLFLAYELRRKFANRPWWKFISYATDVAMLFIFIHALKLGGQLQTGWFRKVWWFYGVTLVMSLGYIYAKKITRPRDGQ